MNKKDSYYSMEDTMGMNPYMGMSMMPMDYPMVTEDIIPNMAMMSMQPMMPMNPMMMRMDIDPMMVDDNMAHEDYINYMINMNKYMAYMYEAEAYRIKAMEYMNKID